MPRKIRELVRDLVKAGFKERTGKGSHRNYSHPLVAKVVTISGNDGDDARRHLEKTVQEAINEVNQWRKATDT
jgi:predicted RNA binding protein YcfA (HicA-like mRNA interferase family)